MATQPHPPSKPQPEAAKPKDPQDAKLEAHAAPPRWDEPGRTAPTSNPDGPSIADQQRESSAKIEAEGMAKYLDEIDERPREERGAHKQVPGVAPPTKRS